MRIRLGAISILLMYLLVNGASLPLKDDNAEDDEDRKSDIPLVVSIPSKVYRFNKLQTNDVISSPLLSELEKARTTVSSPSVLTTSGASTETVKATFTSHDASSTTTTTTALVQSSGSTDDEHDDDDDDHLSTTVAVPSTDDSEPLFSTKLITEDVDSKRGSTESSNLEDSKKESRDEEKDVDLKTSDSTDKTTSVATLITDSDDNTDTSTSAKDEDEVKDSIVSTAAINLTSSKSSDDVVERDYGQSLGGHSNDDHDGTTTSSDKETDNDTVESKSTTPSSKTEDDVDVTIVGDHRDDASNGPHDHPETEEVDPLDEGAQASEVDYAVVLPGDVKDSSAVQTEPEDSAAERRSLDWDDSTTSYLTDETSPASEDLDVVNVTSTTVAPSISVKTLSTVDDLVTSEKTTVPEELVLGKKTSTKSKENLKLKIEPMAEVIMPQTFAVNKKTSGRTVAAEVTDSSVADIITDEVTERASRKNTSSTLFIDEEAELADILASTTMASKRLSKIQQGRTLEKSPQQPVNIGNNQKDLEPAESAHESAAVVSPDAEGEIGVEDINDPHLLDSQAEASNPEVINGEGEYDYIYEYVDVNSTDIPENFQEGTVVTDDGLQTHPSSEIPKTTPEEVSVSVPENVTQPFSIPESARPPSFRTFEAPLSSQVQDPSLFADSGNITAAHFPAGEVPLQLAGGHPVAVPQHLIPGHPAVAHQPLVPGQPTAAHHPLVPGQPTGAHQPLIPGQPTAAHQPLALPQPDIATQPLAVGQPGLPVQPLVPALQQPIPSLIPGHPLDGTQPVSLQPVSPSLKDTQQQEGALQFIPGIPDSPVYFVGIQREKIPLGAETAEPAVPKESLATHSSNILSDDKPDKGLSGTGNDQEQLNALYALSRALPLDDNLPFLITPAGDGNTTVVLPPHLPDPFSEELLGEAQSSFAPSSTTELPATVVTELIPETTTILTTTTTEATTTTSTTTTEIPTTQDHDEKGTSKPPKRGHRVGVRRRTTTTTTTPEAESPVTEAAPTTPNGASSTGRRGSRPGRIGAGGRRKITTTTAAPEGANSDGSSSTSEGTEKTTTSDRSRFGSRGRGRLAVSASTATSSRPATTSEDNGKEKESNSITNGSPKRPVIGRRTTTARTTTTGGSNATNNDKETTTRSSPAGLGRGRRPQFTRNQPKVTEEKTTTTAAPAASEATSATATDAAGTGRKQPLFKPRGRGRFHPKSKSGAAPGEESGAAEHGAGEDHAIGEGSAAEHKGDSAANNSPKVEDSEEAEVANPAAPSESTTQPEVPATEAPSTEASGPPRKFPPRFRPGQRPAIPHRSTESNN